MSGDGAEQEYRTVAGDTLTRCPACGAVVAEEDQIQHAMWHETLRRALRLIAAAQRPGGKP